MHRIVTVCQDHSTHQLMQLIYVGRVWPGIAWRVIETTAVAGCGVVVWCIKREVRSAVAVADVVGQRT